MREPGFRAAARRPPDSTAAPDAGTANQLIALFALALVAGVYFVTRYGGRWAEADSGVMAQAIRVVTDRSELAPASGAVYPNGYGYQAISSAILAFTGLSVESLQQLVYPIVTAVLVLPAWTLYRELTGSTRIASLATLLLLLVPEHEFAVLRGSHERFDRAFVLTAVWLLVRSLRVRGDPTRFAVHIGLALAAAYGLIATNALFGMSFAVAIVTALVLSLLGGRAPLSIRVHATETTRLLAWTSVAIALILVTFVLFLYPPILPLIRTLSQIPARLIALVLSGGSDFDPYAYLSTAWVSSGVFLLLSMTNILILAGSALTWLWLGWSWLRGRGPATIGIWMLWLLYAAFAVQGAATIVSDRSGVLSGNVQYRAFAVFSTMAAPLCALVLASWQPRPGQRRLAGVVFAMAMVAALLKSTLEPSLSNKWLFYATTEIEGLQWADAHQRSEDTWVGLDDRLPAAYDMVAGSPNGSHQWAFLEPDPGTPSFLVSTTIRLQSARLGTAMPSVLSRNLIYDNGDVRIYRARDEPS
jgi:hypothetical protein